VWYTVYATSDDIDELKKQLENLEKKIKKINKLIRDHKNEGHVVARY
jgi:tetrahydromethanopterin S-methyltransferase subunit G